MSLFEMIRECKRIEIEDYREWIPGKDSNGGCYSYHYEFVAVPNGYKVRYSTSADFEYCEKYGNFGSCHRCPYTRWKGDVWSCSAPDEIWSLKHLLDFIIENKNEDFQVFIDGIKIEWL